MSAIIYRAPDSTGVAKFGNMGDPINMRKNLGSVAGLFEVLEHHPINTNCDRHLLSIWQEGGMDAERMQKRLIEYEGLPLEMFNEIRAGRASWPVFEQLISPFSPGRMSVYPGCPGKPLPLDRFTVRSRNDLRRVVETMLKTYDLSFVAIKSIFRTHLEKGINALGKARPVKASVADIYNAFDHLFQMIFEEYRPVEFTRQSYKRVHMNPHAKKYIWQLISGIPVKIPDDFDNDGIKNLFRLLDEALLSRIHIDPGISDEIQKSLNYAMTGNYESTVVQWPALYGAEKGVNVYGKAAAAVLEWMQKNEILRSMSMSISSGNQTALSAPLGVTGPKCLNYLVQPVITQGRWALQSEVTLKNAHPFVDERRERSIVLNGQFAASVEEEMRDFLAGVVGVPFRSDNSSEYFALLWGYYFDVLKNEKRQFQQVKDQVEKGLEEYAVGSNTINYQIFKQIRDKGDRDLDEVAFVEAARRFTKNGGQIAVAGISVKSPRTVYAVSNNRPLFIVRRRDTHDYMVVSDVNASLGLFSQMEIMEVTKAYESLLKQRDGEIKELNRRQASKEEIEKCREDRDAEIDSVLTRFAVDVYALEGENLFARISTEFKNGGVERNVEIMDFEGRILHDIEPYRINLTPPHVHKDLDKSFYKTHLEEVPELLENMVDNVLNSSFNINGFSINERYLKRRFGANLSGIKRVFIAGMGASYHAALAVSGFIRETFPDIQVIVRQPVEIDLMKGTFIPEEDLVLLLSWSSTTAEMVKLSKELYRKNILFIGVTEKIFGDMALVARKSCGVVYVMSGEEVTVSAVKSTFCSMMSLVLFSLHICRDIIRRPVDWSVTGGIMQISHYLKSMTDDKNLEGLSGELASQYAGKDGFVLIDSLHSTGTGREAVMKMEEMTWSMAGKAIDYDDVNLRLVKDAGKRSFLVVNATCAKRFSRALEIMETLYIEGIPFCAVTFEGTETEKIRNYAQGNLVLLPKLEDNLQPFVDFMFYYMLAFHFGGAVGRKPDDYPRNRAKSVTTSRSVGYEQSTPQGEFFLLKHKEQLLGEMNPTAMDTETTTHLEKVIRNEPFAERIRGIKHLAAAIEDADPTDRLLTFDRKTHKDFARMVFSGESEAKLKFVPLDAKAEAAVRNVAARLKRFVPVQMRIVERSETLRSSEDDTVNIAVSSCYFPHDPERLEHLDKERTRYFGPECMEGTETGSAHGYWIRSVFHEPVEEIVLYTALSLVLLDAWAMWEPEKVKVVQTHFKRAARVIENLMEDKALCHDIYQVMGRNREYRSALILSPPDGTGLSLASKFDDQGKVVAAYEPYGAGAHGPLVTVDNRVGAKYVRLERREMMVEKYGEENVRHWESVFMENKDIDRFLEGMENDLSAKADTPFFAEGDWYLPLLRHDYDVKEDNLVILDASNERYLDHAADDLAVFGCRHARLVLVSQDIFLEMPERRSLFKFPVSGILRIPALEGAEQRVPLTDFLTPFALDIVGNVMAAALGTD